MEEPCRQQGPTGANQPHFEEVGVVGDVCLMLQSRRLGAVSDDKGGSQLQPPIATSLEPPKTSPRSLPRNVPPGKLIELTNGTASETMEGTYSRYVLN